MGQDSSEIRREIELTRARMGDTVEALAYKSDVPARVRDAVDDKVESVKGTLGGVAGNVKDTLSDATGTLNGAFKSAKRTVGESLNDPARKDAVRRGLGTAKQNPLGVGLGALAVGFLAGLLAPTGNRTRRRDRR